MYRASQYLGLLTLFIAKILRFVFLRYVLMAKEGCCAQKLASQRRVQLVVDSKMCKHRRYVASCRLATNDETSFRSSFKRSSVPCSLIQISAYKGDLLDVKTYPSQSIPRVVDGNWEWVFGRKAIIYVEDYSPEFHRQGSTQRSES
jgi:hypothetical protein